MPREALLGLSSALVLLATGFGLPTFAQPDGAAPGTATGGGAAPSTSAGGSTEPAPQQRRPLRPRKRLRQAIINRIKERKAARKAKSEPSSGAAGSNSGNH